MRPKKNISKYMSIVTRFGGNIFPSYMYFLVYVSLECSFNTILLFGNPDASSMP